MKWAPNIIKALFLIVLMMLSCRDQKDGTKKPPFEQRNTMPTDPIQDSIEEKKPTRPAIPETETPTRARKSSRSDLDTLRPVKA